MTALDRVITVVDGERAVAVRHVPMTLPVFDHHFPNNPVLPGVLVLEDLAATAALALPGTWRLTGAERVRYRHYVRPGDELELDVRITSVDGDVAVASATARTDRVVTTVRALRMEKA